jgi:serine/threonine protein kinase
VLDPGAFISHYRIVSPIGAGGMGEVYLAEDTKLGRHVALKVLLPEVSGDKDRVRRFIQEAKAASALNHPNILTVYEIGNFDGSEYIAAEFIKGTTLREKMRAERLRLLDALEIALQTTAALDAAHQTGIVHRDLKPENIMIRDDHLVKVLDFGLAKLVPTETRSVMTTLPQLNTQPGVLIGTVAYMSPEQARGRPIDPRSDIFSFGIVLFELFAGRRPFDGESHLDLISSILKDEAPLLRQVAPDMPRELERIVEKTLRKDREHRYQHVRDLHIDLEDLRDEIKFESKLNKSVHPTTTSSVHATQPSNLRSAFATGLSKTRRFTLLHALIFLLLLAASGAAAIWYFAPSTDIAAGPRSRKTAELATWSSAPGELFGTAGFSPDGKMIAFASTRSGTKAIWVTQSTSSGGIQVTNDQFSNTEPIWSPKGDELAYLSRRPAADGTIATSIWRVPALGGTPRAVAPVSDGSIELRRWTPGGKIYYQLSGDLYAIDIQSGTSQKITSLEAVRPRWVSIADDEKSVLYAVSGDDSWAFFLSDTSASKNVEVGKGTGRLEGGVAWSPSKNRIFFSTASGQAAQVMALDTASGRAEAVAAPEMNSSVADVSPDGRSIVLGSSKEESNLWRVNVADGRESPIARDLDSKLWPAVSPDNSRVAFQSIRGLSAGNKLLTGSIVAKSLAAGSDADQPALIAPAGFLPEWSSDGSQLAYLKVVDGVWTLFIVDASGGAERRLASFGGRAEGYSVSPYNLTQAQAFAWSPSEKRIAFAAERNGVTNLYAVSTTDGTESPLTANSDASVTMNCPVWSRDGKKIAFSYQMPPKEQGGRKTRGIRVLDLQSGSVANVIESTRVIRLVGWAADGSLVAAEADKDNSGLPAQTNLIRFPAGGAETPVAALKNIYFYNIALSDDGKQIAYAAREENLDDIWTLPFTGAAPRKLTKNNDTGQFFSRLDWLRDGSAIVFGKQTRFSLLSLMSDID